MLSDCFDDLKQNYKIFRFKMQRKNMSLAWKDFIKLSENEVECKICQVKLKYNGSSTSSMIKHLKLVHNKYPEQSTLHRQPSLSTFGFTPGRSCNEVRQNMITNLIASMVAEHNLPLLLPEWDGFRKLMAFVEPNYKPTCAETIKQRIKQEAEMIKNKIKLELENTNYLALTTDAWTSAANESFMAVTASFITKKWEILSPVLETINLTERHTTDYLSEVLKKTCEQWQICSKVEAIVHDNASNVCRIASVIDGDDIGCAAHTLQLCINEAMGTKTVSNHPISRVVNAASHLVGHFNHSCLANNEMIKRQRSMKPDDVPKKLIQYCKTRWNSIYDMFERLDELRWPVVAVLSDSRLTKPSAATALCLKEEQWGLIQSLIPILKQLKIANSLFCGEEYASISLVYPVLHPLINIHLNSIENDSVIIKKFKAELNEQLQRRFFNKIIIRAAIASALDPRFKKLDFFPDDYKTIIKREIMNLSGSVEISETSPRLCQNPTKIARKEDSETEDEESAYFGSTFSKPTNEEPENITFAEEYEKFVNSSPIQRKDCPLLWWKENEDLFPRISLIAKKYLCVPATSVASERHFSAAGRIITKQRSRLLPETSRSLLFVNRNSCYMNMT